MKKYDVIIAGGGVSGFAAAIGASQAGARVLLFDRQPSVGGTAVYAMTPVLGGWKADRKGGGYPRESQGNQDGYGNPLPA